MARGRRRVLVLLGGTVVAILAACSDTAGGPGTPTPMPSPTTAATATTADLSSTADDPAAGADAATAMVVCARLVEMHTALQEIANRALDGISPARPEARPGPLRTGYEQAITLTRDFTTTIGDLDVPDIPERTQLVDELALGLERAIVEFEDEQADFGAPAIVEDDDVFGTAGRFLNGFEKANSAMEPSLEDYPREALQDAFMDEESCRFVVQPVGRTG